jgi:4-amino-4-deoxy-L-arabinose transferase-like glycosyltransferase
MSRRKPLQPEVPPLSPLPPPHAALPIVWRWATGLLVCAYISLTLGHLYVTPVAPSAAVNFINAPDEAAHLAYARAVAEGRLPASADTYEWHQPPLYYALAAPLYRSGPRAVRWLSLAFGLAGLWVLFRAARRLFPDDPALAVFAMGFAALLPMRQAITASAGNDALNELTFSLAFLEIIYAFRNGFTLRRAGLLGMAVAAAMLTKATGLLLVPVISAALYLLWREGEKPVQIARGGLWFLAVVVALTGLWYARNLRHYGEFTPLRSFVREFEGTAKARDMIGRPQGWQNVFTGRPVVVEKMNRADYLLWVADWTFGTFWAAYTPPGRAASLGIPFFLPPAFYLLYALFTLAAAAGLVRLHFRRRTDFTRLQRFVLYLLFLAVFLVAASFAGFIWTFFQAQGRYLYPAMLPLSLLAALGFRALIPPRYRDAASGLALALFCLLALAFLLTAIMPAYS